MQMLSLCGISSDSSMNAPIKQITQMKMSLSVDAVNGELELPTQIDEGLWSSLIAIKGYEDLESKTFLYLNDVPIDSMIEKIMLRPKILISNFIKTNLDDQLLQFIRKNNNDVMDEGTDTIFDNCDNAVLNVVV